MFLKRGNLLVVFILLAILFGGGYFFIFRGNIYHSRETIVSSNQSETSASTSAINIPIPVPTPTPASLPQKLSNPPEIIKAVYVTGYSAGSKKYLDYLDKLFKNTEINAVVVDIKESDGKVSYNSEVEEVQRYGLYNGAIKDVNALVEFFHDRDIYVIGRIVVFLDPIYSKIRPDLAIYNKPYPVTTEEQTPTLWKDYKGATWLDPTAKGAWDYNISLAKNGFYHGFDEINFDYIRFPSDGKTQNMSFHLWDEKTTKAGALKGFFEYLRQELTGEKISVDLFGQVTTNRDDMGIGQLLEYAFASFDYISPMVYPSHYINGFMGFSNPADHPYEIVKYSMETALTREKAYSDIPLAKFRPWLQDFNMGAYYTADMVRAEIRATQDALGEDYNGYMLWNPSNVYTQGAIK